MYELRQETFLQLLLNNKLYYSSIFKYLALTYYLSEDRFTDDVINENFFFSFLTYETKVFHVVLGLYNIT